MPAPSLVTRRHGAPARVAVIGAGGIGALVGGSLARLPGVDVTFCVRRPFDRLVLEGDETVAVDASVAVSPDDVAPVDWVLLATKAHQTDGARPWLDALAGPAAPVVVLQNGVEHVERVGPLVGAAAVVPAIVRCGGEVLAPGRVAWRVEGPVSVPATDEGRAFVALSEGSRVPTMVVDD
ncbi:MAG TPA: 2-dehydropantoate 2-reductase N-terminal domain-containing protein, partial [Iamia sp.]|nr:2-dehydropantoate 2-reductase N-terminal domain-containing protein [Iamia sp.]